MKSSMNKNSDQFLDLERDFCLSEADLHHMKISRAQFTMTLEQYLDFLEQIGSLRFAKKERRKIF